MSFFVGISCLLFLNIIDKQLKKVLIPYLDIEVERLTTNIVNQAFNEISFDDNMSLLKIEKNRDGAIEKISYNTSLINQISNEFQDSIQTKLLELEDGKLDDYLVSERLRAGKFRNIKNGIICEVSLGSLRGSVLFANVGPVIPIRLLFLGQVSPDIDVKVKEYGINNVMVEVIFTATVKEQISMPFSSKRKEIVISQPIAMDIIRGEIPHYYNGFSK